MICHKTSNGPVTIPDTLANDPKYKKYVAQVDRCLATFDNVHEWADFIAFLTKLLKVRIYPASHMVISLHTINSVCCAVWYRHSNPICNSRKSHVNS
jgi:hypothetical protein